MCNRFGKIDSGSRKSLTSIKPKWRFFGKKTPYGQIFTNVFQKPHKPHGNTSFCANFLKFGRAEVGEIARCLMDKKNKISARPPAAASTRITPKICQGQLQTIDSEFPKFHPNPFTSGGVIAERVNIVQTRHKVFAILGEASASSPSKKRATLTSGGVPSSLVCRGIYVTSTILTCDRWRRHSMVSTYTICCQKAIKS